MKKYIWLFSFFILSSYAFCNVAMGGLAAKNKIQLEVKDLMDDGIAMMQKGDFDGAITNFSKANELSPLDAGIYVNRGRAKCAKKDFNGALADVDKAIELSPKSGVGYNSRAWLEVQNKEYDTATIDATRAIQIDPKNGYFYGTRGWARYGNQDVAGSLEDLKKAVELTGAESLKADEDMGLIAFINGDYAKAIYLWQRAVETDASRKPELEPWVTRANLKINAK